MVQYVRKRPSAGGASRGGETAGGGRHREVASKPLAARILTDKVARKRRSSAPIETIEARLDRKAAAADTKSFATKSLGQMSREQRHKLLYDD